MKTLEDPLPDYYLMKDIMDSAMSSAAQYPGFMVKWYDLSDPSTVSDRKSLTYGKNYLLSGVITDCHILNTPNEENCKLIAMTRLTAQQFMLAKLSSNDGRMINDPTGESWGYLTIKFPKHEAIISRSYDSTSLDPKFKTIVSLALNGDPQYGLHLYTMENALENFYKDMLIEGAGVWKPPFYYES